uniref:SH3 domain-containing protein n=1 Tax=Alexandrium catenella TaxID=2925 RepID=A0A7S1W0G4_ALECA
MATLQALIEQAARPLPKPRTVVQTRDPTAERKEMPLEESPFSKFFTEEGDDAEPQEKLTIAEQRSRFVGRRTRPEDAVTLRDKRLAACRKMGAEMARAEIEATWREPELSEEDETFEVVHSMAVIKEAPNESAADLGVVRRGEFIQVKSRRVQDSSGHAWVELTFLELLRSCSAHQGSVTQGFALIDATHMGVGPLLRGPISRDAGGQEKAGGVPTEAAGAEGAEGAEAAAGTEELGQPAQAEEAPAPVAPAPAPEVPAPAPAAPAPAPAPTASPAAKAAVKPSKKMPANAEIGAKAPKPKASSSGKAPKLIPHSFKVSNPKGVTIREGPSEIDLQIAELPADELLDLEEETFDGWAKLAGVEAWVRRCSLQGEKLVTHLRPVDKPPLMTTTELQADPGPRTFEVVLRPRVAVKIAPRPTAKLLCNANFGEFVLGMSQTYDGWVRLVRNEGWVCGIGRESGQMLR